MQFKSLRHVIMIGFSLVIFISCRANVNATDSERGATQSVSGFDIQGNPKTCSKLPRGTSCTNESTPNDQFVQDCLGAGHVATLCACHQSICDTNLRATGSGRGATQSVSGFDIQGNPKTCSKLPRDTICTHVITPDNQFVQDCLGAGHVATLCACHQSICDTNLR